MLLKSASEPAYITYSKKEQVEKYAQFFRIFCIRARTRAKACYYRTGLEAVVPGQGRGRGVRLQYI